MSKEFFHYPETAKLFDLLEETSHRSGVSRAVAFEDFLTMSVCALSGGRMEDDYLQTVAKHTAGKPGKRGCDSLAHMFGQLVAGMEQDSRAEMKDLLGDLFQGGVSYGENGLYLTPMPLCDLMARLTVDVPNAESDTASSVVESQDTEPSGEAPSTEPTTAIPSPRKSVLDPACGSGRMLLAVAQRHRNWEFVGQDVDLRCVQITALNLAFRNLYGYVIWGNTLAVESKRVYRTGFDGRGFLREIAPAACPAPVQQAVAASTPPPPADDDSQPSVDASPLPRSQLRLF